MLVGLLCMIGCTTATKNDKIICAMEDPDHPGVLVEVDCDTGEPIKSTPKTISVEIK
jgi:hypothetical protein